MIDETIDRIGRNIILNTLKKNAHFSAATLAPVFGVDTKTLKAIAKRLGVKIATTEQHKRVKKEKVKRAKAAARDEVRSVVPRPATQRYGTSGAELDEIRRKYAAARSVQEVEAIAAEYGFSVERIQKVIRR